MENGLSKVMRAPGVLLAVYEIPSRCQVLDDVQINKEVAKPSWREGVIQPSA